MALRTFAKSVSGSGAFAQNGGVIVIPLNKTFLTSEYDCDISIAQVHAGAQPTSSDVRRMFKSVQLVADKGDGVKLNFHAAYDIARFTNETAQMAVVELGAAPGGTSTVRAGFKLNGLNDGAIGGMVAAWLAGKYSSLELRFELNPDTNTCFIGGVGPAAAAYSVDVYPHEYRDQTPANRGDTSSGWGVVEHSAVMLAGISGGVAGVPSHQLSLKCGNKTRFLVLHAFDAAAYGNLTDAVFANGATVSLNIDGKLIYNNTSMMAIKGDNLNCRRFQQTGAAVLDAGNDPRGWFDLRQVKDQKLDIAIPASANLPVAWRIEVAQDYTLGLELMAKLPELRA